MQKAVGSLGKLWLYKEVFLRSRGDYYMSFPLLILMPCPTGLSSFQFLQQLLFSSCLPAPLCGLWAAEPCLVRDTACVTALRAEGYWASPEQALQLDHVGQIFVGTTNIQLWLFSQIETQNLSEVETCNSGIFFGFCMLTHKRIHTLGKYFMVLGLLN